jgi:hypothetical protein
MPLLLCWIALETSAEPDAHRLPKMKAHMAEAKPTSTAEPPDPNQAELAQAIIESLLYHTRVVSDLIALMAQALDQETTRALTMTPQWQAYLESRRRMEQTSKDVEEFVSSCKPAGEN